MEDYEGRMDEGGLTRSSLGSSADNHHVFLLSGIEGQPFPTIPNHFLYILIGFIYNSIHFNGFPMIFSIFPIELAIVFWVFTSVLVL